MAQDIVIVTSAISTKELSALAEGTFGDMIKGVVDIEKRVMALGPELHADAEQALLDQGSSQKDLWGFNVYVALPRQQWIEYDSMINIRPSQGNRSRSVEDERIRTAIAEIVNAMITD